MNNRFVVADSNKRVFWDMMTVPIKVENVDFLEMPAFPQVGATYTIIVVDDDTREEVCQPEILLVHKVNAYSVEIEIISAF